LLKAWTSCADAGLRFLSAYHFWTGWFSLLSPDVYFNWIEGLFRRKI